MSGNETDDTSDEVSDIKNAMRMCRTRQRAFQSALSSDNTSKTKEKVSDCREQEQEQSVSLTLLKKQHCSAIIKLEKRCIALEEELNYTKKMLKAKDKSLEEESHLVDLKVQAIDAEYKQSYGEMKKILTKNNKTVKHEVSKLFYVLSMIERNTLHGRHLTLSETNVGLLLKMRSGLEDINNCCDDPDKNKNSSISGEVDDDGFLSQSPLVDTTLLEICKHLEDENSDLKKQLATDQIELQKYRNKASKTSLIPHYRAAIVKTREECKALKDEVKTNKEQIDALRAQLERKSLDIQKFEAHMSKMEALQFQLKEERDKYKAVIFDVIEDKQPGLYRDSRAKHEDRDGVKYFTKQRKKFDNNDSSTKPHQEISDQKNGQRSRNSVFSIGDGSEGLSGREALMEENLSVLDCEIDNLRRRLELAAVTRTQSIMAEVVNGAAVKEVRE